MYPDTPYSAIVSITLSAKRRRLSFCSIYGSITIWCAAACSDWTRSYNEAQTFIKVSTVLDLRKSLFLNHVEDCFILRTSQVASAMTFLNFPGLLILHQNTWKDEEKASWGSRRILSFHIRNALDSIDVIQESIWAVLECKMLTADLEQTFLFGLYPIHLQMSKYINNLPSDLHWQIAANKSSRYRRRRRAKSNLPTSYPPSLTRGIFAFISEFLERFYLDFMVI